MKQSHPDVMGMLLNCLSLVAESALDWLPPQHTKFVRRGPGGCGARDLSATLSRWLIFYLGGMRCGMTEVMP
jgi:hypothetical protein